MFTLLFIYCSYIVILCYQIITLLHGMLLYEYMSTYIIISFYHYAYLGARSRRHYIISTLLYFIIIISLSYTSLYHCILYIYISLLFYYYIIMYIFVLLYCNIKVLYHYIITYIYVETSVYSYICCCSIISLCLLSNYCMTLSLYYCLYLIWTPGVPDIILFLYYCIS